MLHVHLLDVSTPFPKSQAVVVNCGTAVRDPVALAGADSSLAELEVTSSRLCSQCRRLGFGGRRYQYAVVNGQEALIAGLGAP